MMSMYPAGPTLLNTGQKSGDKIIFEATRTEETPTGLVLVTMRRVGDGPLEERRFALQEIKS